MMGKEFCIMPDNPPFWRNRRVVGLHRHEVFFGIGNRKKSIRDGMVIFLTPELHNMSDRGIHFDRDFDLRVKQMAERIWLNYYGKTTDDFIKEYGKNYL